MVDTKKQQIASILVLLFLSFLPLGQIAKLNFPNFRSILISDLIVFLCIFYVNFRQSFNKFKIFYFFIGYALFSFLINLINYFNSGIEISFIGILYLIRLFAYFSFFVLITGVNSDKNKEQTFDYLLLSIVIAATIGWYQYIFIPDLTILKNLGWDDHLYRLTGSFFDPGFMGIILVVGVFLGIRKFLEIGSKQYAFISLFLFITLLFTYSRASYVAFLVGIIYFLFNTKKYRKYLLVLLFLPLVVILLPRRGGEGVKLEREFSIYARLENYTETLQIWKSSPLFGVGYNNICTVRELSSLTSPDSHACYGADSSLLLILATTGVIGLIIFLSFMYFVWTKTSKRDLSVKSILLSVFVHSFFVNSMFYAFVMGILAIVLGFGIKDKNSQ